MLALVLCFLSMNALHVTFVRCSRLRLFFEAPQRRRRRRRLPGLAQPDDERVNDHSGHNDRVAHGRGLDPWSHSGRRRPPKSRAAMGTRKTSHTTHHQCKLDNKRMADTYANPSWGNNDTGAKCPPTAKKRLLSDFLEGLAE